MILTERNGGMKFRSMDQVFLCPGGIVVDTNLTMSQQCTLVWKVANNMQGCTGRVIASRSRKIVVPLYFGVLGPVLGSSAWKKPSILEWLWRRATKMMERSIFKMRRDWESRDRREGSVESFSLYEYLIEEQRIWSQTLLSNAKWQDKR